MKKYVITEAQLKTIVEKFQPVPKDVVKAKPMTVKDFLNAIEIEKDGEKSDKDDLKSFVGAKMGIGRAKDYLNKTDDALDKIAGGSAIKGYSIVSDDPTLTDANNLSVIILSLVYYFYKEGKLPRFNKPNVLVDLEKNYNIIKTKGLEDFKVLLKIDLRSNWITTEPDDQGMMTASSPDGLIQANINTLGLMTTSVKYSFMDSATLGKFYEDVIKNKEIMIKIQKAINKGVKPEIKNGSLIFNF